MEKFIEIRTYFWWTPRLWIMQSELLLLRLCLCSNHKHHFSFFSLIFISAIWGSTKQQNLDPLKPVGEGAWGEEWQTVQLQGNLIFPDTASPHLQMCSLRLSRWMSQANTPLVSMTSNSFVLLFLYCACPIQRKNNITKSF